MKTATKRNEEEKILKREIVKVCSNNNILFPWIYSISLLCTSLKSILNCSVPRLYKIPRSTSCRVKCVYVVFHMWLDILIQAGWTSLQCKECLHNVCPILKEQIFIHEKYLCGFLLFSNTQDSASASIESLEKCQLKWKKVSVYPTGYR